MSYLRGGTNDNKKAASESFLLQHREWTLFELLDASVLVYTFLYLSKHYKKGLIYFIALLISLVYLATIKGLCRIERHKMEKILYKG